MAHAAHSRLAGVAVALLAAALAGCGSGVKLSPVKGQVFHGEKPAEGATVVLHPKNGGQNALTPSGTVRADGSFTLATHPHGAGAPPGEYVALVTWYPPDAREQENPKNRLPPRYADPEQSPFRVTVTDAATDLEPFRIPPK